MKLKEVVNWMELSPSSVKAYLAKRHGVNPGDINGNAEIPLSTMMELADRYPKHTKRIIITCNPDDILDIKLVGRWNGRLMRAAERVFGRGYKVFQNAIQQGKENTTFRTRPTREQIEEEKRRQAEVIQEREIRQGIRAPEGEVIQEKVDELKLRAPLHERNSAPAPRRASNRANSIPNPEAPLEPVAPREDGLPDLEPQAQKYRTQDEQDKP